MAGASSFLQQAMLDWVLGGSNPTQPPAFWAALDIGSPTFTSASEMGTLTGYARQTALFGAATNSLGVGSASASNTAAMTFGPFSSAGSALGVTIWDSQTVGSTNMLWYGQFGTGRTFGPGETLVFPPGALVIAMT